jgi:hypothetical protein
VIVNVPECEAAGVDPEAVRRIARRLSAAAREAKALGLHIFGGSGSGSLRSPNTGSGALILAELDGAFDGGDGGADTFNADGLLRGER